MKEDQKEPTPEQKEKATRKRTPSFDEIDKQILTILVNEPNLSQNQIGAKVGLTGPAINNRIQRLKANKILLGFAPIIALEKIGYDMSVLVNVKIKNGKLVEAAEKYAHDPHVSMTFTITGEYDMVVIAKFHTRQELHKWNENMTQDTEYIERVNTSLIFTTQKEATNPNKIE